MDNPKYLYRFFKKRIYRDRFIQGLIRFGSLEGYREIEDEKIKDMDGGKARGKYKTNKQIFISINNVSGEVIEKGFKKGDVSVTGESPNTFFIVSLSGDKVDIKSLSEKFGKYVVKINNIQKLLDSINENCKISWSIGKIRLGQVEYNKGEHIRMEKNGTLPFRYFLLKNLKPLAARENGE